MYALDLWKEFVLWISMVGQLDKINLFLSSWQVKKLNSSRSDIILRRTGARFQVRSKPIVYSDLYLETECT